MINYPPKPWEDGQQFKTIDSNGEEIVGTYDASKNAWTFTRLQEGVPGGGIGFVTTEDVQTTPSIPTAPDDWTGLDLTQDVLDLKTQKQVNWFLSEAIVKNKEELEALLWIGENPPDERDTSYIFWWHTLSLELLVKHNGQWFPVAIPPAQVETLRQEIDAIYESIGNTRRDIVYNKNDIDTLALDVDGKIATLEEELEQLAPSLERGSWVFTLNHPPGPGEYTMISAFLDEDDQEALCTQALGDCQVAAGGDPVAGQACSRDYQACINAIDGSKVVTTDDWTQCDELVFNNVDMNGVNHGWGGIDSDHYIDVFNMNDENYMVGDIATHGGGTFSFDLVSSKGVASGPATIKIFKSEGTIDFDQYLRKTGGTVTGDLRVKPGTLKTMKIDSGENSNLNINRNGEGKIVVRKDEVKFDVPIKLGTSIHTDPFQAASVKFAQMISGRKFVYRSHGDPEQLQKGEFTYAVNQDSGSPGDYIYISDHDVYGQAITTNGKFTISENTYVRIFTTTPHSGLVGFIRASKIEFGNEAADGKYNTFTKSKTYRTPSGHTDGSAYYISDTIAYP